MASKWYTTEGAQVLLDAATETGRSMAPWLADHLNLAFEKGRQMSAPQWCTDKQVNDQGCWWWWNGDPDSGVVPVSVMWSGGSDIYFATQGQLGWNRPQDIIGMGGLWLKMVEPNIPDRLTAASMLMET